MTRATNDLFPDLRKRMRLSSCAVRDSERSGRGANCGVSCARSGHRHLSRRRARCVRRDDRATRTS
eukprot:7096202-Pyramimonas_sp.AAC.1